MRLWVNILSASGACPENELAELVKHTQSVQVFSTIDRRFIGNLLRLDIRDTVDLWGELKLEEGHTRFERAAAILVKVSGSLQMVSIMATNLSREAIKMLTASVN